MHRTKREAVPKTTRAGIAACRICRYLTWTQSVRPGHANKAVEAGVHTSFVHSSKISLQYHFDTCILYLVNRPITHLFMMTIFFLPNIRNVVCVFCFGIFPFSGQSIEFAISKFSSIVLLLSLLCSSCLVRITSLHISFGIPMCL